MQRGRWIVKAIEPRKAIGQAREVLATEGIQKRGPQIHRHEAEGVDAHVERACIDRQPGGVHAFAGVRGRAEAIRQRDVEHVVEGRVTQAYPDHPQESGDLETSEVRYVPAEGIAVALLTMHLALV